MSLLLRNDTKLTPSPNKDTDDEKIKMVNIRKQLARLLNDESLNILNNVLQRSSADDKEADVLFDIINDPEFLTASSYVLNPPVRHITANRVRKPNRIIKRQQFNEIFGSLTLSIPKDEEAIAYLAKHVKLDGWFGKVCSSIPVDLYQQIAEDMEECQNKMVLDHVLNRLTKSMFFSAYPVYARNDIKSVRTLSPSDPLYELLLNFNFPMKENIIYFSIQLLESVILAHISKRNGDGDNDRQKIETLINKIAEFIQKDDIKVVDIETRKLPIDKSPKKNVKRGTSGTPL